jgi:hypothetical protein
MPIEIVFVAEEAPEGGYVARALGFSIFTEAETIEATAGSPPPFRPRSAHRGMRLPQVPAWPAKTGDRHGQGRLLGPLLARC